MMLSSLTEKLVTRSTSSSAPTGKTPVSHLTLEGWPSPSVLTSTDVIVLTAMGEEAAVDAKEAPGS